MERFIFEIPDYRIRWHRGICIAMFILNFFLIDFRYYHNFGSNFFLMSGLVLSLTGIILSIKKTTLKGSLHFFLILIIINWMLLWQWLPILFNSAMLVTLYLLQRKVTVAVSEKNIQVTSIPMKQFSWDELNNVKLKDGILTIDCKNNRLIQVEVAPTFIDESHFNLACVKRLTV